MSRSELNAVIDLLSWLFLDWRVATLVVLLMVASVIDVRSHRIPNKLVLAGIVLGLACNWFLPHPPRQSVLFPLEGFAVGLATFLPLYLLRTMGAGDVKLMAMVGTFIGPGDAFLAALATMAVGGVFAVGYALVRGTAFRLLHNLFAFLHGGMVGVAGGFRPVLGIDATQSAGKLPYALCITTGSIGYLVVQQLGLI